MSDLNLYRDIPDTDMAEQLANTLQLVKHWHAMSDFMLSHLSFLSFYARENLNREDIYQALRSYADSVASYMEDDALIESLRDMTVALPVHGIDFDNA
ncbi:hypothetical protein PDG61_08705 [Mycolicibacterium sp. BiH015]|uniref:hypothetical protein n=1 Tax=Mycolicibacterium sp. BiH015 TaxID=3018808 RepID=UPI0022DF0A3F|nr:hypothetical protein [Mycolicibacterium sp. BiH015]MDA2890988.1 hypothetical protein [Mycolicibacterium sp. BiH015]